MDEPPARGTEAEAVAEGRRRGRRRVFLAIAAAVVVTVVGTTALHLWLARGDDALGQGSGALFGAAGMGSMTQTARAAPAKWR